jgi:tetratricopeptide (TPR) repeat protein
VNERVVSHYRLVETLGSGSMGRVYKAWDTKLDRWVAIKFLPPELAGDTAASDRFHREAYAASSLEHGHICSIYDIDQDETGAAFMVMAYYEGETIAEKLKAGPLPAAQALEYARQVALGLSAAHRQGIVHRDIKPANIIVTRDDEAVILDFGVAYLMDQTRLSRDGSRSGTLAYMAPEQFRGGKPQLAMDIWSLGVLLYEMLTGRLPFKGDYTAALTYAIAHDEPLPLPAEIAAAVPNSSAVMARCLAKDPGDRYRSVADLAADLGTLANDTKAGLVAHKPVFWIKGRWRRRITVGAVALVLVAVGVVAQRVGLFDRSWGASRGVAVLPIVVKKDGAEQREFGDGLTWLVANRLGHLAGWTDEFWVVPPGDVFTYEIADRDAARTRLGVERTITASGIVHGTVLTLEVEYNDGSGRVPLQRVFHDDLANLPTWQREVMRWIATELDPGLDRSAQEVFARGNTQVPAALYDFLAGVAWLRRPAYRQPEYAIVYQNKALAKLAAAVDRDSSYAAARSEYAHALILRHDQTDSTWAARSESQLRAAMGLDPLDGEPHLYLGDLRLALRDTESAIVAYDAALRREPGCKPALLEKLGFALARDDQAMAERQIAAMQSARPGYALDYLHVGRKYADRNDLERSVAFYREALRVVPRNPVVMEHLGATLWRIGMNPETEVLFRRALEIEPTSQLHRNLGVYYYYDNRYEDAIREYQKSLALDPIAPYYLWRQLAECYLYAEGYEDSLVVAQERARRKAEVLADAFPDDVSYRVDVASFCADLGDRDRALAMVQDLVTEPNLSAEDQFMISFIWESLGRRAEALAWLERALDGGLGLTRVENYPGFRNLRTDPQYAEIVKDHH